MWHSLLRIAFVVVLIIVSLLKYRQILSNPTESWQVMSNPYKSYQIMSNPSNLVKFRKTLTSHVKSCQILANPCKSCQIPSNPVKSKENLHFISFQNKLSNLWKNFLEICQNFINCKRWHFSKILYTYSVLSFWIPMLKRL